MPHHPPVELPWQWYKREQTCLEAKYKTVGIAPPNPATSLDHTFVDTQIRNGTHVANTEELRKLALQGLNSQY